MRSSTPNVPAGSHEITTFQQTPPCPGGFIYTVQPNDSLFLIARKFSIPLNTLIAANPQIIDPNQIFPGQRICIPRQPQIPPPPDRCPGGFFYTVQSGDTLFILSQRFNVSIENLERANPQVTDPNLLFPGQILCIPPAQEIPPPSVPFDCILELRRTAQTGAFSSGVARVENYASDGWEILASIDQVPEPSSYRFDFNRFVLWVVRSGRVTLGIPLRRVTGLQVNGGVWTGFYSTPRGQIAPFEELFITPEPTPTSRPTGPIILRGRFRDCF